jgi:cytochrome c556
MHKKTRAMLAAFAATSLLSLQAIADTTPEDAADYRKALMTALRGHIGAASMIARGLVEDDGHLVSHARGLADGARELGRVFQEGSNVGESEALPVIWEEPEAFAAAVAKTEEATAAFLAAAESGDKEAIGAAFRDVGMSCRGCHDNYRVAHD